MKIELLMVKLNRLSALLACACWLLPSEKTGAADTHVLYENHFEKAEAGKVPEDMMVLDGAFAVKDEGGNRCLELPGAPLDTYGLLFGPTTNSERTVSARIHGTAKGRRFPAFGLGLNGIGGYKLQVSPGRKALELSKGEEVVASVPYSWESDSWTMLRLQVRKTDASWNIEGKAWKQGGTEPETWAISHEDKVEPAAGRASIWGSPFSTTPIQYDDLVIRSR